MQLWVAAQDVVDCSWILFPCVSRAGVPSVLDLWQDLLGLVGYEGTKQKAVLLQIESSIVQVALGSILHMVRFGNKEELAAMWYTKEIKGLPRPFCDQVPERTLPCGPCLCIQCHRDRS